ncbi:MAG: discoidin domain-containing protein [Clostridia bacterium]|nr:discoidin domain-containing protein [Clostridia bacterium]
MKKYICILLCFVMTFSGVCYGADSVSSAQVQTGVSDDTISAYEEKTVDCTFDTYTEQNSTSVKDKDNSQVLLCGDVYKRTIKMEFDISSLKGCNFGGVILSLYLRNAYPGSTVYLYGYAKGEQDDKNLVSSCVMAKQGKFESPFVITSFVETMLSEGKTDIVFEISTDNSLLVVFSSEYSDKKMRPYIYTTENEAYIKGQKDYVYPEVSNDTFISSLQDTIAGGHPYLFGREKEFEKIRENAFGKNIILTENYQKIKDEATKLLSNKVTEINVNTATASYIGIAMDYWANVSKCAFVYRVEKDERFAQRAWDEVNYLCSIDDWGTYQLIDNVQTVFAVALCYDWLYDWLNDQQKTTIIDALKKNHFDMVRELFANPGLSKYKSSFYQAFFGSDNFSVMMNINTFISVIAIADSDVDYASNIMQGCFKNLEKPLEKLYPDSSWYEGLGYWGYVGPYVARWLSSMKSSFGTCFGLENIPSITGCAYFTIYGSSSNYPFCYNDMTRGKYTPAAVSYTYGVLNKEVPLQKYAVDHANLASPFELLVFDTNVDYNNMEDLELGLDKFFRNNDLVTMRSTWNGNQELFGGMVIQDASASHGQMNSGTIGLDALGESWITNPGRDKYSLPGYFESTENGRRWNYYNNRAEANSCIVINPSADGGQKLSPGDTIDVFKTERGGAYAWGDLTETYADFVTSYKRGIMLGRGRTTFVVQDEIKLYDPSEVYAFYNIYRSDIEISDDKKSAIISKGNKKLKMNILCDADYELSVMDSNPLPTSPQGTGSTINREIERIAIHFIDAQNINLRVEFIPYLLEEELPVVEDAIVPIEQWKNDTEPKSYILADGLYADGELLDGFNAYNRCYIVDKLPETFEAKYDESKYECSYYESNDQSAKYIILKDKESDEITSYMISLPPMRDRVIIIDTTGLDNIGISKVNASTDDGNVPENTFDGDLETRWSAEGNQWISFELAKSAELNCVAIAFYEGHKRMAYFDLQVSDDGKTWKTVNETESTGNTSDYEYYSLGNTKAKYIRFVGYGNSKSGWNSISEVQIFGK